MVCAWVCVSVQSRLTNGWVLLNIIWTKVDYQLMLKNISWMSVVCLFVELCLCRPIVEFIFPNLLTYENVKTLIIISLPCIGVKFKWTIKIQTLLNSLFLSTERITLTLQYFTELNYVTYERYTSVITFKFLSKYIYARSVTDAILDKTWDKEH